MNTPHDSYLTISNKKRNETENRVHELRLKLLTQKK
jgi:hypothetical protein